MLKRMLSQNVPQHTKSGKFVSHSQHTTAGKDNQESSGESSQKMASPVASSVGRPGQNTKYTPSASDGFKLGTSEQRSMTQPSVSSNSTATSSSTSCPSACNTPKKISPTKKSKFRSKRRKRGRQKIIPGALSMIPPEKKKRLSSDGEGSRNTLSSASLQAPGGNVSHLRSEDDKKTPAQTYSFPLGNFLATPCTRASLVDNPTGANAILFLTKESIQKTLQYSLLSLPSTTAATTLSTPTTPTCVSQRSGSTSTVIPPGRGIAQKAVATVFPQPMISMAPTTSMATKVAAFSSQPNADVKKATHVSTPAHSVQPLQLSVAARTSATTSTILPLMGLKLPALQSIPTRTCATSQQRVASTTVCSSPDAPISSSITSLSSQSLPTTRSGTGNVLVQSAGASTPTTVNSCSSSVRVSLASCDSSPMDVTTTSKPIPTTSMVDSSILHSSVAPVPSESSLVKTAPVSSVSNVTSTVSVHNKPLSSPRPSSSQGRIPGSQTIADVLENAAKSSPNSPLGAIGKMLIDASANIAKVLHISESTQSSIAVSQNAGVASKMSEGMAVVNASASIAKALQSTPSSVAVSQNAGGASKRSEGLAVIDASVNDAKTLHQSQSTQSSVAIPQNVGVASKGSEGIAVATPPRKRGVLIQKIASDLSPQNRRRVEATVESLKGAQAEVHKQISVSPVMSLSSSQRRKNRVPVRRPVDEQPSEIGSDKLSLVLPASTPTSGRVAAFTTEASTGQSLKVRNTCTLLL